MKTITVLLSTYNGEKYLVEQIDSVLSQEGVKIKLLVRDDGSTDGTISILNSYAEKSLLYWYKGDNLKPLGSFMHLLFNCRNSDYYAFCDQDDVWLPSKLSNTLRVMMRNEENNPGSPVLVHTDMRVVDSNLNLINNSFWDTNGIRPDILNNYVDLACYNGVNGCTILLNNPARELIKNKYFEQNQFIHDVFCALTVSGNGGIIDYLDQATLLYRQHENNVVGADKEEKLRYLKRLRKLLPVIKNNYSNFITINRIKRISLSVYLCHKIKYIFTKKHGIRK